MIDRRLQHPAVLLALLVAAIILYWPSISIGLLADDFALVHWAEQGRFAPREWPYFRPTALALWRGLFEIVGHEYASEIVHTLSIVLHALNGWLVYRVALALGSPFVAATGAAMLFLTYPTAVEAVTWPSAVSDVLLVTLTLTLVLDCWRGGSIGRAWVHALLAGLALGTKETAVAVGPLLLCVGLAVGRDRRRTFVIASGISFALTIVYIVIRMAFGDASHPATVTVSTIAVVIAGPFAALLFPFHESVSRGAPLLMAGWIVLLLVSTGLVLFTRRHEPQPRKILLLAVAWVVVAAAPTIGLFAVGADLQGARYVYLPSALWCIALAGLWLHCFGSALGTPTESLTWPGRTAESFANAQAVTLISRGFLFRAATFVLVVAGFATTTRLHQEHFTRAARIRDVVLASIAAMPSACDRVFVIAAPDHYRGVYVARNGLREAVLREYGRQMDFVPTPEQALPSCRIDFQDLQRDPSK